MFREIRKIIRRVLYWNRNQRFLVRVQFVSGDYLEWAQLLSLIALKTNQTLMDCASIKSRKPLEMKLSTSCKKNTLKIVKKYFHGVSSNKNATILIDKTLIRPWIRMSVKSSSKIKLLRMAGRCHLLRRLNSQGQQAVSSN